MFILVGGSSGFRFSCRWKPDSVVLLGPITRATVVRYQLAGRYLATPLGDVKIDTELADAILHETSVVDVDEFAHRYEHSIEVQLPFLQFLYGNELRLFPSVFDAGLRFGCLRSVGH
jgi:AmmeMemoRadiSam system protein B